MSVKQLTNFYLQATSWISAQSPLVDSNQDKNVFAWDETPAYKHFVWHKCFGDFKCARLQVPMDWLGTSNEAEKTVELAVVKVEATVPVTDPAYGGAIVLNPGGPGGSGVDQVLKGGHHVRTMLSAGPDADNETAKHFDVIGFDPRGINNTRPLLTCFPNHLEATAWTQQEEDYGLMKTSDISFDNLWAAKRAVGEGCSKRAAEEGIAKHMSTAPVARDIVEIFERHGEWREAEAQRILNSAIGTSLPSEEDEEVRERTSYKPGKEMVQYWGFSYGTILGATLSTMFPEHIKRAVLDGVADSHDYMAGGWSTNLRDTDLTLVKLADYCFQGGAENCPIYDSDGPAAIIENIKDTMARFQHNPLSAPGNGTRGPRIVTYNDFKLLIRDIVYNPLLEFPLTTEVLRELGEGECSKLAEWKAARRPILGEPLSTQCKEDGPFSPSCFPDAPDWDATFGIACSDGASRLDQTKDEYRKYADSIIAQSSLLGEWWAAIQMRCTAWHARPNWRYEGNFHNKTAHPILFAGNTIDPVTPLYNAFSMAKGFDGAAVLHQNSEGHCTYASPSMCTGKALREYFQSGTLPGAVGELYGWSGQGALCEPNILPLHGYSKGSSPALPKGESDQALWDALVGLNQVWP